MSKTLRYVSAVGVLGTVAFAWTAGCSSSGGGGSPNNPSDSGPSQTAPQDGATPTSEASASSGDATSTGDGSSVTYTLIDDMEMTTHGPIELPGIVSPESPGYWFNFGGSATGDTLTPPYTMFTFSSVSPPTTTLNGKTSAHAAHQFCSLNGQYDVCGLGFEFAQVPDPDAGIPDAGPHDAASDGGDGGPSIPQMTVPFDISKYKGITFWGKSANGDAGGLDVKVQFPDTDTDPRGGVCNGPNSGASSSADTSQCFNSYAEHVTMTGDWQEFTIMFTDLVIDSSFGFQSPSPWSGTNVYGINWQGQDNNAPDSGTLTIDFWVDDVYFIQ